LETLLSHVDSIPYLQKRLDGWTQDLSKMTDQTVQSLYAIGSGGLKGLGLGNSVEKQLWLPESTNDFIFSVVCEELGFIGAVLIIVLFVLFIVQGLLIAYKAENLYCTMVGIGIMAQIAWQVFCNIAVVTNTLPNTGISLPFFSSGGTSLILLLAEMGVMVNIGRNGERVAQQRGVADPLQARNMARLAGGDLLELGHLVAGESDAMRKEHFDLFCSLMRLSYNDRHLELIAWAEDAAQLTREQQRAFLRDAARLLRESFMLHAGIREVSYLWGEELAFCSKFAPFVGPRNIEPLIAEIESAAAQIAQNGNPTIVFTHFALSVSKMIKHL